MVPRLLAAVVILFFLYVWSAISLIGHDRDLPIPGCRRALLRFIFWSHTHLLSTIPFFTILRYEYIPADKVGNYEEYLGSLAE